MSVTTFLVDAGFRSLNVLHRAVVRASGGRLGSRALGMEIVELTTTGRRSGQPHRTMLTVPLVLGEQLVLVASKGGDDRDPDWYVNLLTQPEVDVLWRGVRYEMRATPASEEQRAAWWPRVVAVYRPYASYQRRTTRPIPLVVCAPRTQS
ncbi:MAG: nitroreductase family deazaflavin-dependent oxidoreductase [Acidobacteriota bacterium]|nr:nitroreductase family deazaflavin-dependent oxidoreductase [Acidobacteriota bacterium]